MRQSDIRIAQLVLIEAENENAPSYKRALRLIESNWEFMLLPIISVIYFIVF